jgi:hypothetical protein
MQWDRQLYDDVALERIETSEKAAEEPFHDLNTYHAFKLLIERYRGGHVIKWGHLSKGSFNIVYRMRFQEGGKHAILRIPRPGIVQFPDEKVRNEVAVMRYVAQKTTIPIPHVYYCGMADENPTGLGPFIIMDYAENEEVFSSTLKDPELREKAEQPVLDPDVTEEKLECLYGQMAKYVLQLAKLEFPRIGSLVSNGRDTYVVGGRPLTMNMNALILLANIPPAVLPPKDKTYQTADEWYLALADMHMAHLVFQRNDLTRSPDDCRNKYVARQLFRRLAKEGRLTSFGFADDSWSAQSATWRSSPVSGISTPRITRPTLSPAPDAAGPFRLWCDDLRGGNILLDRELRVAAIIDWEFAYVGPPQFALDPPWWLLLSPPEYWPKGLED